MCIVLTSNEPWWLQNSTFHGFWHNSQHGIRQDSYQSRAKFNTDFSNKVSFAANKVYGSKVNVSHHKKHTWIHLMISWLWHVYHINCWWLIFIARTLHITVSNVYNNQCIPQSMAITRVAHRSNIDPLKHTGELWGTYCEQLRTKMTINASP